MRNINPHPSQINNQHLEMTHDAAPATADTTSHSSADAWTDSSTSHVRPASPLWPIARLTQPQHDHSHHHHHHHHHHDHIAFPIDNSAAEQAYYPPPSYGSIMQSNYRRTNNNGRLNNDDLAKLVKWAGFILLGTFLLVFGMFLFDAECRKRTPWAERWC